MFWICLWSYNFWDSHVINLISSVKYFSAMLVFVWFSISDRVVLPDHASAAATQASKEEVDSRSIYVGNVGWLNLSVLVFFVKEKSVCEHSLLLCKWFLFFWIKQRYGYGQTLRWRSLHLGGALDGIMNIESYWEGYDKITLIILKLPNRKGDILDISHGQNTHCEDLHPLADNDLNPLPNNDIGGQGKKCLVCFYFH